MKKVFSIIAVAAMTAVFVACGNAAEDKAKAEARAKFVEDSTNTANAAMASEVAPVDTNAAAAAPAAEAAAPAEKH